GPFDEPQVQSWFAAGFFSSDVKFQISESDHFDPEDLIFTLGELVELNGRTLPFYFSVDAQNERKDQEDLLNSLLQEVESLRVSNNERDSNGREVDG
ncbi:hypothetical protein PFISCL1PPCAC_25789, partial [Pristionchus fissidentatus]